MNRKKKSRIKVTPLKGRFFDISPPKGGAVKRGRRGFWRFAGLAFLVFIILIVINLVLRGRELFYESQDLALKGYGQLQNAIQELEKRDLKKAGFWFDKAEKSFNELSEATTSVTRSQNQLLDNSLYLDTANKLIESGIAIAEIGKEGTELLESLTKIPELMKVQGEPLMAVIRQEKERFENIYKKTITLQNRLTTLNQKLLPDDLKRQIKEGQEKLAGILALMREADQLVGVSLKLLGDTVPQTYLVLLQNNHELRATGGFIGSYVLIDVNDGKITRLEAKDVYETDGQLTRAVTPPPGIDQVTKRWAMRDANYSPDFPSSAEKIMWFLEESRGPSVDTVIAIDPTVVEALLELTGPIRLAAFSEPIDAEHFTEILSFYTETKLSGEASPKKLLFDFIPAFREQLTNLESLPKIAAVLQRQIRQKHIQAYSKDPEIQQFIRHFALSGAMTEADPENDFLALVTTSIGGNKSDAFIETQIGHHTDVAEDGGLKDTLTIQKTHTWNENSFKSWQRLVNRFGTGSLSPDTLRYILGEGANKDYLRVYLPKGSELTGVEGIALEDIAQTEDLGYTVYAFTFGPLPAGQSQTVTLHYKLPYKLDFKRKNTYRLIIQKQAGAENQTLKKTMDIADSLHIAESYPTSTSLFSLTPVLETELDENKIFLTELSL